MTTRSARSIAAALLAVGLLASAAHAASEANTAAAPDLVKASVLVKAAERNTAWYEATVAMWTLAKQNPQAKIVCLAIKVTMEAGIDQYGNPTPEEIRVVGLLLERNLDEVRKYRSPEYFLKSSFSNKYVSILNRQRARRVSDSECEAKTENSFALTTYLDEVRERIKAKWVYPRRAGERGIEGELVIEFSIAMDGRLEYIKLQDSSGTRILDEAAMTAVRLAQPFDPVPDEIAERTLAINGRFRYQIVNGLVNLFLRLENVVSDSVETR
jgi:TonB family protein